MMEVNSVGICVCCISIMIRYSDSDNFVVTIISSLSINQLYDMLLNIFFKMTEVTDLVCKRENRGFIFLKPFHMLTFSGEITN